MRAVVRKNAKRFLHKKGKRRKAEESETE